jgi:hypothetical protein
MAPLTKAATARAIAVSAIEKRIACRKPGSDRSRLRYFTSAE